MTELIMASIPSYERPSGLSISPRDIPIERAAGGLAAKTAAAMGDQLVEVYGVNLEEAIAITAPSLWAQTTAVFAGFGNQRVNTNLDEGRDLDPELDLPVVAVADVRIPLALRARAMRFRDRIADEAASGRDRKRVYFAHHLFIAALAADTMDLTVTPEEVPVPGSLTVVSI